MAHHRAGFVGNGADCRRGFILGDFREDEVLAQLQNLVGESRA